MFVIRPFSRDSRLNYLVTVAWVLGVLAMATGCSTTPSGPGPSSTAWPGRQPDGYTRLHNQWLIKPVGDQIALGDFPVNLALDPSGRFAAVLHAGYKQHEIRVIDLRTHATVAVRPVHEAFQGIAFSPDGRVLVCSGGGDEVLHVYGFDQGRLTPRRDIRLAPAKDAGIVGGVAFSPDGRRVAATILFDSRMVCADLATGRIVWNTVLNPGSAPRARHRDMAQAPNAGLGGATLDEQDQPLAVAWDPKRDRIYATQWGRSAVSVLDASDGSVEAQWKTGLHPNELLLLPDSSRLFVANGGGNTITVLDAATGETVETLCSALAADDPPGSTPDALALDPTGQRLFAANAYNDNVAVFDVSDAGHSRPLGFIPTGWFPTALRVTPDGGDLIVVSARGLEPKPSSEPSGKYTPIGGLYAGSLGIVALPRGNAFDSTLA
ncbi:MAG TPA: beta-propeller fold lactonase family protein, partial [Opitutaceae bacterium]|nr:beta-propeller fold lactonase family protein [Opitutaceae bacterium]